jgi:hypothetical protein
MMMLMMSQNGGNMDRKWKEYFTQQIMMYVLMMAQNGGNMDRKGEIKGEAFFYVGFCTWIN